MMPELGKYTVTVMGSYIATIALLAALVALTLWKGARVKRALSAQEERMKKNG
ncbi:MAG: heme exporter protein CcmD [Paracoccaceae bacterium]|jgi:heme exporter protein D|nr:heme exporter protein CcmD [Paracoccaceae bacterium]